MHKFVGVLDKYAVRKKFQRERHIICSQMNVDLHNFPVFASACSYKL